MSRIFYQRPVWVGMVVRFEDGRVRAFQVDDSMGTPEVQVEIQYGERESMAPGPWVEHEPDGTMHLRFEASGWARTWNEHDQPTPNPIESATKAIESGSS